MLEPHSERTSLAAELPPGLICVDTPPAYGAEWEKRVFVCHRAVRSTGAPLPVFPHQTSVTADAFSTNLIFSAPLVAMSALSHPGGKCFVYRQYIQSVQPTLGSQRPLEFDASQADQFSSFNQTVVFQPLVDKSSQATCMLEGRASPTVFESAVQSGLSEVHAIVSAIRQARPLTSTPQFNELLRRAAQAHGTPDNIEEWARQLAEDVSELAD